MDYEENYDRLPINFQIVLVLVISGIVVFAMMYPIYAKTNVPQKLDAPQTIKNESIAIQIVTIMVTPTPDGKTYFTSEYESGIKRIGEQFSWLVKNASGYKDMSIHTNVYDYRVFDSYNWFNPTDYKYYREMPSNPNSKFLFVFAYIYMDDVIGDDVSLWLPDNSQYVVYIDNIPYYPIEFEKQLRIRELEHISNHNKDYSIGYYGTTRLYSRKISNMNTAGEIATDINYLRGGISNKIDGYIVYEIPKNSNLEDISVIGTFFNNGWSQWKLHL